MLPLSSSTSNLSAGHTTVSYHVTEEEVLSDTPGSLSTQISPRSAGAHTVVYPLYVLNFLIQIGILGLQSIGRFGLDRIVANTTQAHEKHRAVLEATPEHELSYPLGPKGNAAEVNEAQKVTDEPLSQR